MDRLGPRVHVSGFTLQQHFCLALPSIQTCTMRAIDDTRSFGDDMRDQGGVGQPESAEEAGFSGRDQHSPRLRRHAGHASTHPRESANESELQRVLGRLGNAVLRGALTGMSLRGGLHLVSKALTRSRHMSCPSHLLRANSFRSTTITSPAARRYLFSSRCTCAQRGGAKLRSRIYGPC